MAVAAFVKACTLSTFSLSLFSPETEECARLLHEVENSPYTRHSQILHTASRPVLYVSTQQHHLQALVQIAPHIALTHSVKFHAVTHVVSMAACV